MADPAQARNELHRRRLREAAAEIAKGEAWRFMRLHLYELARLTTPGERAAGVYDAIARIERCAEDEYVTPPAVHTMTGVTDG